MNEGEARDFLLVRAVEIEDRDQQLLTREDRAQADVAARGNDSKEDQRHWLARRATFAATRLQTRHPRIGDVLRYARWPRWMGWAVPLAALILGLLSNEIGSGKRMNIIAFPLVGMFAWNFAVYLWIALHGLLRMTRRDAAPGLLARLVGRLGESARRRLEHQDAMGRALAGFLGEWTQASAKLTAFRAARTLHLGAAMFAVGVIGGLYLRALGIEYRAGWESTFLKAPSVHALVSALLGPASAFTGVALPDAAHIATLNWNRGSNGENAAPWIHLYAATAFLFVIAPRLALALWNGVRGLAFARNFPVPGREDFYVRRLLRSASGGAGVVRVTPYAYRPSEAVLQRLTRLIRAAFGDATRIEMDGAVDYGAEESWLAGADFSSEADHHLLLFNLASTPEAENHGEFAREIAKRLAAAKTGTSVVALLDESAYRQRLGSGQEDRVTTRRSAWEDMLTGSALTLLSVDLEGEDEARLVPRLEAALARDAAMGGKR